MFSSCTRRKCVYVYPRGTAVGLFSVGGSSVSIALFFVSLSAPRLLRVSVFQYSGPVCQINSAPEGESIAKDIRVHVQP